VGISRKHERFKVFSEKELRQRKREKFKVFSDEKNI